MFVSFLCLCVLFFAQSPAANDDEAKGLAALDRSDYGTAEQIFTRRAAADPTDYSAQFNLALAEAGLGKNAEAAEHFRRTLELKPHLYEAELNLGMIYLRDGRPQDAVPLLSEAAKAKPGDARTQRYWGDSLLATNQFAAAADAYRNALAANPKLAPAELGLGQALMRQDKLDDALPHFRQAATLDAKLQSYLLEMAAAFSKANRDEDAIRLLQEFPNDPGAQEELGRVYLRSNKPADAVTAFQKAVSLAPTPANRVALASAYLKNNQPDLASPILEDALKANPNDYELRMVVGRLHRDRRDFKAAADQFLTAARLKPDSVEPLNEAVSVLVMAEQYGPALGLLDKIHAMNADAPGNLYYRAMILDKLQQPKPALAAYQQFLQMSNGKFPDQEFVARQRARILQRAVSK